jgi:hypothetical protein
MERRNDVCCAAVVLGAGEEVCEDVLHPRAMPSVDGDVILQREGIDCP